jgi:hypothetical protein
MQKLHNFRQIPFLQGRIRVEEPRSAIFASGSTAPDLALRSFSAYLGLSAAMPCLFVHRPSSEISQPRSGGPELQSLVQPDVLSKSPQAEWQRPHGLRLKKTYKVGGSAVTPNTQTRWIIREDNQQNAPVLVFSTF